MDFIKKHWPLLTIGGIAILALSKAKKKAPPPAPPIPGIPGIPGMGIPIPGWTPEQIAQWKEEHPGVPMPIV